MDSISIPREMLWREAEACAFGRSARLPATGWLRDEIRRRLACRAPVRNAGGKKKPENQKTTGMP